jgi:hypothetical protein
MRLAGRKLAHRLIKLNALRPNLLHEGCLVHNSGPQLTSGKFCPADLHGQVKPDFIIPSIADLPEWWERAVFISSP